MKFSNLTRIMYWLLALLAGIPFIPCHAADAPKCAPTPIPVQIIEVAKSAPWPNKSYDSGWAFDRFVDKITKHLVTVQAREQLCFDNADGKRPSRLTFEKWPDFTAGNEPFKPTTAIAERPAHGCRIISPWIDIVVERKPIARIRAIVRWNPRQFFVDQAALDGSRNLPAGNAMPLTYDDFSRFAEGYGISGGKNEAYAIRHSRNETRRKLFSELWAQRKLLDEHLPPDLVFLFHGTVIVGSDPITGFVGEARDVMDRSIAHGADDYANLVMALIDSCIANEGRDKRYSSVLDIDDLMSLEKYKIRYSHRD